MTWAPASLAVGLAAAAGLVLWGLADPHGALQGWLVATMAWIGVPLGSLILLLAHILTGGRWAEALRPVLLPAAGFLWLGAAALVPVGMDLPAAFPWAAMPAAAPPGVAGAYLNPSGLFARTAVALAGWILLSLLVRKRPAALVGALGLLFSAVTLSLFAVDWILSVDPGYPSSAFPALFAVEKVLTALAFCAVAAPAGTRERDLGDLSGLMIAGILGVVYLALMTYVVAWYGNLPDKAAWYLRRATEGWTILLVLATVFGALVPFLVLLSGRARRNPAAVRAAGLFVLAGIVLHTTWLLTPEFGWRAVLPSLLGLACLGGLSLGLAGWRAHRARPAHA